MGLHGCNRLCDLHPAMHGAQKQLLDMEGGHNPEEEEKEELLQGLRKRLKDTEEMIEVLENN